MSDYGCKKDENTRVRFAPSPTGYLHVGGARTALFNWLYARKTGGKFLLRIEDTDRSRYNEAALEEIFTSMRWLGLDWDEGPYYQSQRLDLYKEHADILLEKKVAYVKESAVYMAIEKDRTVSFNDAVRGEISFDTNTLEDFVLLKSDGFPTYHLANIIDDHFMNISHVLRGDEWITSTPKHFLLYEAFGWKPPIFAHLPVILGEDGSKLSKRKGAASVMDYKLEGILPDALLNFLALLGWNPGDDREIMSVKEMSEAFDLSKVGAKASVFDGKKLNWMNGQYLMKMSGENIFDLLKENFVGKDKDTAVSAINLMKERTDKLTEIPTLCDFFFNAPKSYDETALAKVLKNPDWKTGLAELKIGPVTRLAISGLSGGPALDDIIRIIGKEECLRRAECFASRF